MITDKIHKQIISPTLALVALGTFLFFLNLHSIYVLFGNELIMLLPSIIGSLAFSITTITIVAQKELHGPKKVVPVMDSILVAAGFYAANPTIIIPEMIMMFVYAVFAGIITYYLSLVAANYNTVIADTDRKSDDLTKEKNHSDNSENHISETKNHLDNDNTSFADTNRKSDDLTNNKNDIENYSRNIENDNSENKNHFQDDNSGIADTDRKNEQSIEDILIQIDALKWRKQAIKGKNPEKIRQKTTLNKEIEKLEKQIA